MHNNSVSLFRAVILEKQKRKKLNWIRQGYFRDVPTKFTEMKCSESKLYVLFTVTILDRDSCYDNNLRYSNTLKIGI